MKLHLLITPLARGAYYDAWLEVATAEFHIHFPGADCTLIETGGLHFLATSLEIDALEILARLSFVQGIFEETDDGTLRPLAVDSGFLLPDAFVYGAKYQGKTNELVTQFAINTALRFHRGEKRPRTLLDPMAGRGTTLFWGLRYGLEVAGIEQDHEAPAALHAHFMKYARLLRISHNHSKGFIGKRNKSGTGAFNRYEVADRSLRIITGDSRNAPELLAKQRFDLIVSDLPYGIQFKGGNRRNPLETVQECAAGWVASLREGGVMVLVFNCYQPKREELVTLFSDLGCRVEEFSAPHRMSESIIRDLLVVTKPA